MKDYLGRVMDSFGLAGVSVFVVFHSSGNRSTANSVTR